MMQYFGGASTRASAGPLRSPGTSCSCSDRRLLLTGSTNTSSGTPPSDSTLLKLVRRSLATLPAAAGASLPFAGGRGVLPLCGPVTLAPASLSRSRLPTRFMAMMPLLLRRRRRRSSRLLRRAEPGALPTLPTLDRELRRWDVAPALCVEPRRRLSPPPVVLGGVGAGVKAPSAPSRGEALRPTSDAASPSSSSSSSHSVRLVTSKNAECRHRMPVEYR